MRRRGGGGPRSDVEGPAESGLELADGVEGDGGAVLGGAGEGPGDGIALVVVVAIAIFEELTNGGVNSNPLYNKISNQDTMLRRNQLIYTHCQKYV